MAERDEDIPDDYYDPGLKSMGMYDVTRPSHQPLVALNVRNINPEIKAQFKAYCARRGYDMNKVIEYLMNETVRKGRILNIKR